MSLAEASMNDYGTPNILSLTVMDVFHFSIESGLHSQSIDFSLPSVIKLAVLVIKMSLVHQCF